MIGFNQTTACALTALTILAASAAPPAANARAPGLPSAVPDFSEHCAYRLNFTLSDLQNLSPVPAPGSFSFGLDSYVGNLAAKVSPGSFSAFVRNEIMW